MAAKTPRDDAFPLSDVPRDSEEWRGFLQERISGLGRTLFLLIAFFYVMGNGVGMLHPLATWRDWYNPLCRLEFGAGVVFATMWLSCRKGSRSPEFLSAIDGAGVLLGCAFISLTAFYSPAIQRPELHAIMGVCIVLIVRAIVIPSSAPRTLILSLGSVITPVAVAYLTHAAAPKTPYDLPMVLYPALTGTWGVLGVMAATLASRVIFGLRQKASEAMRLGQYTLEEKIGEGGMGSVYRANHAMLRRPTAIKLLPAEKSGEGAVLRFEREVQLTSRLAHPNTIAIYDYGRTPAGVFYYAMEYLDGITLEGLGESYGPQPAERVIHIARQMCGSLAEAHSMALIHRDIKPANVILCERAGVGDVVKVLDFGLVKELGRAKAVTNVDALTGTPMYLSPEAITSPDTVDARSDIYAVGCVAYYLLTGTDVFGGATIVEVCSNHLHVIPEPPSKRLPGAIPADVEKVILACLEKDPDKRPKDARALSDMLAACACAGTWTEGRALAWWKEEGPAARKRKSVRPSIMVPGMAMSMVVDFDARSGVRR